MKHLFTLLLAFSIAICALAQPVLTQANMAPQFGYQHWYPYGIGSGVQDSLEGPDKIWWRSTWQSSFAAGTTYDSKDPASSTYNWLYPGANHLWVQGESGYRYDSITSDGWEIIGEVTVPVMNPIQHLHYDNTLSLLRFPCQYLTEWKDTASGTILTTAGEEISVLHRDSVKVTGWGNLAGLYGPDSLTEALLLRRSRMSVYANQTTGTTINWRTETQEWYSPGHALPLLIVEERHLLNAAGTDSLLLRNTLLHGGSINTSTAVGGTGSRKIYAAIFPNPTHDRLVVQLDDAPAAGCRAMLVNATGIVLKMQEVCSQRTEINVADLAPGNYFLRLVNDRREEGRYSVQTD